MDKVYTFPEEQTTPAEISLQRQTAVEDAAFSCAVSLLASTQQDPEICVSRQSFQTPANTMTAQLMTIIIHLFLLSTVTCRHIQTT